MLKLRMACAVLTSQVVLAACERPCPELADRLCSQPGVDEPACASWRQRTSRVPARTCALALRTWSREQAR